MLITLGSANPVKLKAVEIAFKKVFPKKKVEVKGFDVPSGVSHQPKSDEESIKGATNRARRAGKKLKHDFTVGIEAGIDKVAGKYFDSAWVVIFNKKGEIGIGSTIKMETPNKMMKLVNIGMEIGDIDDKFFNIKNSKHKVGHFGLMTNGKLTRKDAYVQGVISALSRFLRPEVF